MTGRETEAFLRNAYTDIPAAVEAIANTGCRPLRPSRLITARKTSYRLLSFRSPTAPGSHGPRGAIPMASLPTSLAPCRRPNSSETASWLLPGSPPGPLVSSDR